jgi:hypothetical protein
MESFVGHLTADLSYMPPVASMRAYRYGYAGNLCARLITRRRFIIIILAKNLVVVYHLKL